MDSKSLALPVKKILNSKNQKRNQDLKTQFFLENYLTVHVSFSQIGSRVANLELKTYPQLDMIFILRKQREKIFGCVLPVTRL